MQEVAADEQRNHTVLFSREVVLFSGLDTLSEYIGCVNQMLSVGLVHENNSNVLLHACLSWYETVAQLVSTGMFRNFDLKIIINFLKL